MQTRNELKIIDYFMICTNRGHDLNTEIAQKLADGWQIYGHPHIATLDPNTVDAHLCFSQAMVKYENIDVDTST